MDELDEEYEQIKSIDDELRAQIKSLRIQMDELTKQLSVVENKKYDLRIKVNRRNREEAERKAAEERERQRQEAIIAQQEALKAKTAGYDEKLKELGLSDYLFTHQVQGSKFLAAAGRALCADSMGTGKTAQAIATLELLDSNKALVFCPGDVMKNFVRECDKLADRMIMVVGRIPKREASSLLKRAQNEDKILVVINYEAWNKNRAILKDLVSVGFDTVIADEAHVIKETDGAPFEGVRYVVNQGRVKNFIAMTGTPILNRPEEIFASLHLIDPVAFPYKNAFIRDFCIQQGARTQWAPGGMERLAQRISGYYLRRTMQDAGIELPPQDVQIHEIEFDEEAYPMQAQIMREIREYNQIRMANDSTMNIASMLALITRERQATIWPGGITYEEVEVNEEGIPILIGMNKKGEPIYRTRRVEVPEEFHESIKLDKAVELINELVDSGHRVVVFSQFKTALAEMERRSVPTNDNSLDWSMLLSSQIRGRTVRYDGDTVEKVRIEVERNFNREFNEEPKWEVVLCNYKTGGVGLNLTAATAIVILDEEWNPGKNDQAYARIWRIGQTEKTQVHILRVINAPSGVDKWMSELIEMKSKTVNDFSSEMDQKALYNILTGKVEQ